MMMMMFLGTETLVTQLENERSRVHSTEVPATVHNPGALEPGPTQRGSHWVVCARCAFTRHARPIFLGREQQKTECMIWNLLRV